LGDESPSITSRERSEVCVGTVLATSPEASRPLLSNFSTALGDATGLKVTALGLWHYQGLLDAMQAGSVDFAWLPPVVALRAMGRLQVIPIALPVRNGVSVYSTALFARSGSPLKDIGRLVGVRAAWVDRQSAAGYIVIRSHLRSLGVDLDQAFRDNLFMGTHDQVVRAVLQGEADVGATFLYLNSDPLGSFPDNVLHAAWGDADVQIITHAGPIPSDVLGASPRVPGAVLQRVQEALLSKTHPALAAAARALFRADNFVEPLREHLQPLGELLSRMPDETE
jgi:phosphate/phosphite/phosphonate ABC transporter binding protein